MKHFRVLDGRDGLQAWRAAANILNKQSLTAVRGGPPVCEFGGKLTTAHRKTRARAHTHTLSYEMLHRASDLDGFFGSG